MSIIALGSAKGSPGVTTTVMALAAAWPSERNVLVVEADPDGGILAARHQLATEPGLSTLAVTSRRSLTVDDISAHTQEVSPAGVSALVAPPAAEHSRRALDLVAAPLGRQLPLIDDTDVLIDVGRFRPESEADPLIAVADAVLFVVRPRLEELQQLPARIRAIRPTASRVGLLLVGERPYPPAEVAVSLDTDVVAVLADDLRGAEALAGRSSSRALTRSPLMRSVRSAIESIGAWLPAVADADHLVDPASPREGGAAGPIADAEVAR